MAVNNVMFWPALLAAALLTCENSAYQDVAEAVHDRAQPEVTVITRGGDEDEGLTEEEEEETPDPPHIGGGEGGYQGITVESVTLDKSALMLEIGQEAPLTAIVVPEGVPVTWVSEKSGTVSVDGDGNVTARQLGIVKIIAKAGGRRAECEVTVAPGASGPGAGLYLVEDGVLVTEDLDGRTEATLLAKALGHIKDSGDDGAHYQIVLGENETDSAATGYFIGTGNSSQTTGTGVRKNPTITLKGTGGGVTLTKNNTGPLFTVYGSAANDKPHLILENITLAGYGANNTALVIVGGNGYQETGKTGELTMKAGSRITGNTGSYNGWGIYVKAGSAFTMEDGSIDNNSASGVSSQVYGGGVCIAGPGSIFTMNGGVIEKNETSNTGGIYTTTNGGVSVGPDGTFIMTGGTIRRNKAGHSAAVNAYGVSARFVKTGGVIYGNEEAAGENANVVTAAGGHVIAGGYLKWRDKTADDTVDLDNSSDENWGE